MPRLKLEGLSIGSIDWDLNPKSIENYFEEHDSLDHLNRYCLELRQAPVKYWEDADDTEPVKMWDDNTFVLGRSDFRKDWHGLPEYVIREIMRVMDAKVIIAQVQAKTDDDVPSLLCHRFEGNPKYIDVKLVAYLDKKVENPTNYLLSIRRKMASAKFAEDSAGLLRELLAKWQAKRKEEQDEINLRQAEID